MNDKVLNSPIRWAGSKKKILNEMLNAFKCGQKNYIESFLGSGVVLINVLKNNNILGYKNFYVNDINSNIINFYKLLKNDPNCLINQIDLLVTEYNGMSLEEQEKFYYHSRERFNNELKGNDKSIYFYFLMKTGFNGVYRENKMGKFNVPFGKKEKISVNTEYLHELSLLIQPVKFYNMNYQDFLIEMNKDSILKDSFLYFDPPYLPDDLLVNQKQELYTNNSFDHETFFTTVVDLNCSYVMISMSDSKRADKIYLNQNFKKTNMKEILRTINPKKLFPSTEISYTNYNIIINDEDK